LGKEGKGTLADTVPPRTCRGPDLSPAWSEAGVNQDLVWNGSVEPGGGTQFDVPNI